MAYVPDVDAESDASGSEFDDTWINVFVEQRKNQYFCAVREDFIEDEFNLTGLAALVPRYKEALELILDLEPERAIPLPDIPAINEAGELLYGLIHARFIITRQGLIAMASKYELLDFGTCPRVMCDNMGLVPIGRHDVPGYEPVRLWCPCCRDLYVPQSTRFLNIDGAFFGSSFAAMFLEFTPEIEERAARLRAHQFIPRLYGFKVSEYSRSGPRMKWLRQVPDSAADIDEDGEQFDEEQMED